MSKFSVTPNAEPAWCIYLDEGDGFPIRFLIAPITEISQNGIDERLKDRDYIASLNIDWNQLPEIKDITKKQATRRVLFFSHIIREWEGIVGTDGVTPLECNMYNIAWLCQRPDLAGWVMERGNEGGGKLVKEEVKNSGT